LRNGDTAVLTRKKYLHPSCAPRLQIWKNDLSLGKIGLQIFFCRVSPRRMVPYPGDPYLPIKQSGWVLKQTGASQDWRKRYMVLRGRTLFDFGESKVRGVLFTRTTYSLTWTLCFAASWSENRIRCFGRWKQLRVKPG
jgi:hypothetical protein